MKWMKFGSRCHDITSSPVEVFSTLPWCGIDTGSPFFSGGVLS